MPRCDTERGILMSELTHARLVFLYDSSIHPWHADLQAIRRGLERMVSTGVMVEELDTRDMSDEDLARWRAKANVAAIRDHKSIRQTFGSWRQGGLPYFGKQVPALLVFAKDEQTPTDVYPHRKNRGSDLRIEGWIIDRANPKLAFITRLRNELLTRHGCSTIESAGRDSDVHGHQGRHLIRSQQ